MWSRWPPARGHCGDAIVEPTNDVLRLQLRSLPNDCLADFVDHLRLAVQRWPKRPQAL
jgi:hypothetical protein